MPGNADYASKPILDAIVFGGTHPESRGVLWGARPMGGEIEVTPGPFMKEEGIPPCLSLLALCRGLVLVPGAFLGEDTLVFFEIKVWTRSQRSAGSDIPFWTFSALFSEFEGSDQPAALGRQRHSFLLIFGQLFFEIEGSDPLPWGGVSLHSPSI